MLCRRRRRWRRHRRRAFLVVGFSHGLGDERTEVLPLAPPIVKEEFLEAHGKQAGHAEADADVVFSTSALLWPLTIRFHHRPPH